MNEKIYSRNRAVASNWSYFGVVLVIKIFSPQALDQRDIDFLIFPVINFNLDEDLYQSDFSSP